MIFSRGKPTFPFLFKRGQINSSSFSRHCYLPHPPSCHQQNAQVALPSALQSRFSFSYITEANSTVITKRIKIKKERNSRGSCPTNPDKPLYWYHPLYFTYFLHYIGRHAGKRSLHKLLIALSQIVSYLPSSHWFFLLCSFIIP